MSEDRPVLVGTMVDGTVVGVALADTPKKKTKPVDGDDCTWDWWQGMTSSPEASTSGDGNGTTDVLYYDTRTGHDVLAARITELEARIAGLEDVVRRWTGD